MADDSRSPSAPRSRGTAASRPLVLVVDDDPDIAEAIGDILRRAGYDVRTAGDGASALEAVARETPGLVLLDWRLPSEPAGSPLVRKLRDACDFQVPIVVVSADPQALAEARAAQVSDYLPKPFDARDLVELVDEQWAQPMRKRELI
jgi:DNA-binding response OmpR family regulator